MPEPPKNDRNFSQKWAYSDIENEFGMWRSEYDITDSWTAYTGLGAQHAHEEGIYSAPKLLDKSGNAVVSRLDTNRISDSVSGMAGIRGNFTTGFVSHKVNVGYSAMTKNEKIAWKMSATKDNPTTNIYHNTGVDMPDSSNLNGSGGKYSDPLTSGRTRTQGWLLSDTTGRAGRQAAVHRRRAPSEGGDSRVQQNHRCGKRRGRFRRQPLDAHLRRSL